MYEYMEVDELSLFKKVLTTFMVATLAVSISACSPKKETETKTTETKTEYITEITKENVEDIVIEYKEVLSYYNDLKNNLKTLSDVNKDPNLERDAVTAKDSIKNGATLLKNVTLKYKPLVDAKSILSDMYNTSLDMADNVVNDTTKYESLLKDYDKLFKEFKTAMDTIREDIEKVRGKSTTQETNTEDLVTDEENTNSTNSGEESNSNTRNNNNENNSSTNNNSNSNSSNEGSNNSSSNSSSSSSSGKSNSSSSSSSNSGGSSSSNSGSSENNSGYVPKVSSLNNSLRSEIRSAGANAGVSFKQSGGSEAQLDKIAIQTFNDIEGDNPIQGSQIAEARSIFVSAFKNAYYSN